jgi:peptidoglycan/LPS O-acetylase OafA/YrhL
MHPRVARLADRFDPRANGIGALRLLFAVVVVLSHSWQLVHGDKPLGAETTYWQADFGALSVYGFFLLSGFLITGSAMTTPLPRYLWHRFLRIFPAFWTCLLVVAFVVAPLLAIRERGTLADLFAGPHGPLQYLAGNWTTGIRTANIDGLAHGQNLDAPLWSLIYELSAYVVVAGLAVTGLLRRAPWLLLILGAAGYASLVRDFIHHPSPVLANGEDVGLMHHGSVGPFPLIGAYEWRYLAILGFLFAAGAALNRYADKVPMHGVIAVAAVALAYATARTGGFFVFGLPAFGYAVFYAAVAAPRLLQRIGVHRDYSYGIYIYGWPVQILLLAFGAVAVGPWWFFALSIGLTGPLAMASWHLIERPALSLKNAGRSPVPHGPMPARLQMDEAPRELATR